MGNCDVAVFTGILETVGVLGWLAEILGVSRDEAVKCADQSDVYTLITILERRL